MAALVGCAVGADPVLPAAAQDLNVQGEVGVLEELSMEELMHVRVNTPTKVPTAIRETPALGRVLTRDDLDRYGWDNLNEVLFRQPGWAPAQDYERVTVSARGLYEGWNNNHLLLLVDGVPFNNVSNGTAYTTDILPLFLAESVEVYRGPGSALYGTSATNGLVALNTRSPRAETYVAGRLRLGNASTQSYDALASQRLGPLRLTAGYNHNRTDGNVYSSFDGSGRTDAAGQLLRFDVRDQRRSHYGFLKLEGREALAGLSAQAHYQYWSFETGHGWLYVVPDEPERANNSEAKVWLTYRPPPILEGRLGFEVVLLGQRHIKDYRIKYLPDNATFAGTVYPGGVVEVLRSGPQALFGRVQAEAQIWREMAVVAGVEHQLLTWGRDEVHQANVDINTGGTFAPFPNNELRPLNPALENVLGEPINSFGAFVQVTTGRLFARTLAATAGARYDVTFFDYVDLTDATRPKRHRSFNQLSPRLGLVGFLGEDVTVKLMAERAFRAPQPSELVIYNSLLATSNTDLLKPEEITTLTLAGDVMLLGHLNLRANGFYERFANQIAFSATQNLAANIYTRELAGFEGEVLFDAFLGANDAITLSGFANYTYSYLLDEEVLEPTITASDRLTWAPAHVANAGLGAGWGPWQASAQLHVQGRVHRRDSDGLTAMGVPTAFSAFRPESVAPWATVDARAGYQVTPYARLGVLATNLFDSQGTLIKTNDFPFDFRIPGRRVFVTLDLAVESSSR